MPDANDGTSSSSAGKDAGKLYGRWYYDTYTVPYNENEHWRAFFGRVADNIVNQLAPRSVLDAGCAKGFLVSALRERGIEASGFDISEYAVDDAPEAAKAHVRVGSLTDQIEGRYDLITCVEVIEHLDPADAPTAVTNLCSATDTILLSSTPGDQDEVTHVNVQPPERWSQLFAVNGFFRDFHHEAAYLSPWAVLYRRGSANVGDVVLDYERAWCQLRQETIEQRRALLALQDEIEKAEAHRPHAEVEQLQKEVLRLRDLVVGREAEMGTALGRVAELEAALNRYVNVEHHLQAVLNSKSWRLMWAAGAPVRRLRGDK